MSAQEHPVHRSRVAKAWLARNERRLRVFFLRRYSPELNPNELLNQDVKTNAVGRKPPTDADDLMANVRGFMRSKQRTLDFVRSYFRGRHVSYAALCDKCNVLTAPRNKPRNSTTAVHPMSARRSAWKDRCPKVLPFVLEAQLALKFHSPKRGTV